MRRLIRYILDRFYRPILMLYLAKERSYRYAGLQLSIPTEVFHPAFFGSSKVFLHFLRRQQLSGKTLLEVGSGSGILSLFAARAGAEVIAIDINPAAVEATNYNAALNELDISVLQSDLFLHLPPQKFERIIVNPPFFPASPHDPGSHAWYCGPAFEYFERFFGEVDAYLEESGRIWMILSEVCDLEAIRFKARSAGKHLRPVFEERRIFERFLVYEII